MIARVLGIVLALLQVAAPIPERERNGMPHIRSESALVRYADTGEVLLAKNPDQVRPIASVTKLLSGLVLSPRIGTASAAESWVQIEEVDKDRLKWSRSRLRVGGTYKLGDLFSAALGASENRAMYATARATGLGPAEMAARMNTLARTIGMSRSTFADAAGLDPANTSTARDLLALISAAAKDTRVREATLSPRIDLVEKNGRVLPLNNPDRLARSTRWQLVIGKTGYTIEAGRSLVLRATLDGRPVDMVFLGAREMASVFGDAGRVRRWLESRPGKGPTATAAPVP